MLRIGAIVLHVADTERAGTFWSEALAYPGTEEVGILTAVIGGEARLHLDDSDRTHLDLWTDSAEEQASEVARLIGLGELLVDWDYPEDADFVVLVNPGGRAR
ncbi:VOC family protein [Nostocoides jenkinsii]|uniref:Glyoxalase-like domain-containing protein n=1 Tax=Nostocoides jenkinsii Ben 74 TaxID=1193518 RepID=A0A077M8N3_9MICO|nr:VOC family protein [Tetrasphaera jenkinsii]CCI52914.1 conserved hypothetical protein [Tetrasphaera jenkinsii Ben 74]